jgi:RNA-directed DNA polymerase
MSDASVPEGVKQASESRDPREWSWVEPVVWNERMLAALGNGVKGGKWFSLWDKVYAKATLEAAWQRVKRNGGAAGVDNVSVKRFASREQAYLDELHEALKLERYRPQPVKRVMIPKPGGKQRPLGIPVVKDRIVQGAVKLVIEPIFEREFLPVSHGFRPERSAREALREVDVALKEGLSWVVDADLASYFDSIPHEPLMDRIGEHISDGKVLALIKSFLKQDVLSGLDCWTPVRGSPQGAVLSPLLANLYLHGLDREMSTRGYRMVRYADDFVILCATREQAQEALARVRGWVEAVGLNLHPEKTQVGDCRIEGQGFEFLGYRFEAGRRRVRKKSLKAFKDNIRKKTGRSRGNSLGFIIDDLNRALRGWFAYFKHTQGGELKRIDSFTRRRLRAILRRHQKMTGRLGKSLADHRRWPNAFFADHGLFSLQSARDLASQSRCG